MESEASKPAAPAAHAEPDAPRSWWNTRQLLQLLVALVFAVAFWTFGAEYWYLVQPRNKALWDAMSRASDWGRGRPDHERVELYPRELAETDWAAYVPPSELLHLSVLHKACLSFTASVLPWNYGLQSGAAANNNNNELLLINETDPNLLERLRRCPDIDIYMTDEIRGHGYCEDAVTYVKFLEARILPPWVLNVTFFDAHRNKSVSYHDLCPKTPLLVFNHYWREARADPRWPESKPLYMMPNIEMYELEAQHYWQADVVLCKTAVCMRYMDKWHKQEGNPRNTTVLFTRHTSTDLSTIARLALGDRAIMPKDFENPVFLHTAGSSIHKGTSRLLDCWLARPDLPPVDIYIRDSLYQRAYARDYDTRIQQSKNVRLHTGVVEPLAFGKMLAEAAFFLCPSAMEGYGHYINQARAAGGLILAPDTPPMNELVTSDSGVLIPSRPTAHKEQFLGGKSDKQHALRGVDGFVASFGGKEVCFAVDELLRLAPDERRRRAERARQQYYFDLLFFKERMLELREFARRKKNHLRPRTGARSLLAHSIAELLEYEPVNASSFLAQHFSFSLGSDDVARCVAWLRARPTSDRRFLETVQRSYDVLCAGGSSADEKRPRGGAARPPAPPAAVVPGKSARLPRREYLRLLEALSVDSPVHVRHRIVDGVSHLTQPPGAGVESADVSRAEFVRGVQACLLIEELLDAVADWFDAMRRHAAPVHASGPAAVDSDVALACLEAAAAQRPRPTNSEDDRSTPPSPSAVVRLVRDVMRRQTYPQTVDLCAGDDALLDSMKLSRAMALSEWEELVVAAVLAPGHHAV
ncbi:hypothetical protein ATCC90586_001786 [Pythium insidiosum]|nr:hypothetical protein ATCC90586_001786 [Pythium insidiosum]